MSYLLLEHSKRERTIDKAIKSLKRAKIKFDTIVSCGLSGALVAPVVAAALEKQLVIVRKGERTHGDEVEIEWNSDVGNYLIIDDLVESGRTIKRIRATVDGPHKYEGNCVGVYFYNQAPNAVYYTRFASSNPDIWSKASLS